MRVVKVTVELGLRRFDVQLHGFKGQGLDDQMRENVRQRPLVSGVLAGV